MTVVVSREAPSARARTRLVSMAYLMANRNAGQSYLDNFLPFVAECFEAGGVCLSTSRTCSTLWRTSSP
jgi:hypothetical protein